MQRSHRQEYRHKHAGVGAPVLGLCCGLLLSSHSLASTIFSLDLEELMKLTIESSSKIEQEYRTTPAAVFVISREDIERSGATSIATLMKMVPGLQVSQQTTNTWAVSSRTFHEAYSKGLLVAVDGQSYVSTYYNTNWWDHLLVPLEEIERIEVIRGQTGTIWGLGAMSGVVNIITRSASDLAEHGVISGRIGSENRGRLYIGDGLQLNDNLSLHGSIRFERLDGVTTTARDPVTNEKEGLQGWDIGTLSLRSDWRDENNEVSLDLLARRTQKKEHLHFFDPITPAIVYDLNATASDGDIDGESIRFDWRHDLNRHNQFRLRAGYLANRRVSVRVPGDGEQEKQWDLEASWEHQADKNRFVIGATAQHTQSSIEYNDSLRNIEGTTKRNNYSLWFENIYQATDQLELHLAARWEKNKETDLQAFLPKLGISWSPVPTRTLWATLGQSAQLPAAAELTEEFDLLAEIAPGMYMGLRPQSNRDELGSSKVKAIELGWREQINERFYLDAVAAYQDYSEITHPAMSFGNCGSNPPGVIPGFCQFGSALILPISYVNGYQAKIFSFELAALWQPNDHWKMDLAYTFTHANAFAPSGAFAADPLALVTVNAYKNNLPKHALSLRSSHKLGDYLTLNWWLTYKSKTLLSEHVDLDVSIEKQLTPDLTLKLVGQNLLKPRHLEITDSAGALYGEEYLVDRGAYLQLDYRF